MRTASTVSLLGVFAVQGPLIYGMRQWEWKGHRFSGRIGVEIANYQEGNQSPDIRLPYPTSNCMDFFRPPKGRGLAGMDLEVSDDHSGIVCREVEPEYNTCPAWVESLTAEVQTSNRKMKRQG